MSQKFKNIINSTLAIHIGINSGLAVTGQAEFQQQDLPYCRRYRQCCFRIIYIAKAGETLVGQSQVYSDGGILFI